MRNIIVYLSLFLALSAPPVQAQGIWSSIKEKAKDAWNSDARKDAWSKTKEVTKETLKDYTYTVPITNRDFIDAIPDEHLLSMSESQYRHFLNKSTKSTNTKQKAHVKRVATRLIAAVKDFYEEQGMESEQENYHWEFNLVHNSEANAFCMPGGKIAVYDGILGVANDDASLAIVLGHEIAHAIAKHSAEQMTKSIISAAGVTAVYIMVSNSDMSARKKMFYKLLTSAGVTLAGLKFSRIDETEADQIGLILAAMAGYNPEAAIPFWKRMGAKSGSKSRHDWYSTHPSYANRIDNIQSFMDEAKEYYRKK